MNNKDLAHAMNTLSHSTSLTQLLTRPLMPSLMPQTSAIQPSKLPVALVERLLAQEDRCGMRPAGLPLATFNAPQPAAHRAATFSYPLHIDRASIDALPAACGVYILRGVDDVPLYVGRSVNLRSRVLAQLHHHEDQFLIARTRRIECRRTAGELGAALLENCLLRDLRPAHNKKPRSKRGLFTLRMSPQGQPLVAELTERESSRAENLFGLYTSQRAAQEALHKLVERHGLCSIVTGLEQASSPGMACFGRQIRRCRGACTGEESHEQHQQRLLQALQDLRILPWPYAGPMGIIEQGDGWQQIHVIDHWRYLGSLDRQQRQLPARPAASLKGFDLESYKLVIQPYLLGQLELRALPRLPLSQD
jgi:excinuclease Cho